jgi:hypothetical protein
VLGSFPVDGVDHERDAANPSRSSGDQCGGGVEGGARAGYVVDEQHVGARVGERVPREFIPELVDLHLTGRLPFDRFCRFYDLERINEAVAATEGEGEVLKPIVTFGEPA